MHIENLHIYPIKSCAGISVPQMELGPQGPVHDREFMIVDLDGNFITQRTDRASRRLCLVRTAIIDGELKVSFPDNFGDVYIDLSREGGHWKEVRVWGDTCIALEQSGLANSYFSEFLGQHCVLVRSNPERPREHHSSTLDETFKVGFADGYPLLVISTASLDDLNARMESPLPMERFRPNIVIGGDCEPYVEDTVPGFWAGEMYLQFAKLCARCPIPSIDQQTGVIGPDPRKALTTYRPPMEGGPPFGSNYIHRTQGRLQAGSELRVAS